MLAWPYSLPLVARDHQWFCQLWFVPFVAWRDVIWSWYYQSFLCYIKLPRDDLFQCLRQQYIMWLRHCDVKRRETERTSRPSSLRSLSQHFESESGIPAGWHYEIEFSTGVFDKLYSSWQGTNCLFSINQISNQSAPVWSALVSKLKTLACRVDECRRLGPLSVNAALCFVCRRFRTSWRCSQRHFMVSSFVFFPKMHLLGCANQTRSKLSALSCPTYGYCATAWFQKDC